MHACPRANVMTYRVGLHVEKIITLLHNTVHGYGGSKKSGAVLRIEEATIAVDNTT